MALQYKFLYQHVQTYSFRGAVGRLQNLINNYKFPVSIKTNLKNTDEQGVTK